MTEQQKTRILDNGLVLLTESIPESEAASYVLRVPFGTVDDPADRQGLAGMIVEMIVRGAGEYNNQQLVYAFENFGIDASERHACSPKTRRGQSGSAHYEIWIYTHRQIATAHGGTGARGASAQFTAEPPDDWKQLFETTCH